MNTRAKSKYINLNCDQKEAQQELPGCEEHRVHRAISDVSGYLKHGMKKPPF